MICGVCQTGACECWRINIINGMDASLLVNNGNKFCAPLNAVPPVLPEPADMSHITQQDTTAWQCCKYLI